MSNAIAAGNLMAMINAGGFYFTPLSRTTEGTPKLAVSPASILAYYIINGLAKMSDPSDGSAFPLWISHMQDKPSNAGAIYDTSGIIEQRQMNGLVPTHQGIQIRIRTINYETGYAKIESIASALDEVFDQTVEIDPEEYVIQNISKTTPIVPLGLEGGTKRRFLFTANFLLTIRKIS